MSRGSAMPDWRAYVRSRVPPLAIPPEREAEIVDELALQLQAIYDGALGARRLRPARPGARRRRDPRLARAR